MFGRLFAAVFMVGMLVTAPSVAAQTDATCDRDALSERLADYAEQIVTATDEEISAIRQEIDALMSAYLTDCAESTATPASEDSSVLFTVVPTGNINIRSCSATTCDIVAAATPDQVFDVVGEDNDWYEIALGDGGTGFIASWLVVRGPDMVLDLYEGYYDADLKCSIVEEVARSAADYLDFAISGSAQRDLIVDIIRPNQSNPEPVWRQYDNTFLSTDEPYISQEYRAPLGAYQLRLERDAVVRVMGFEIERQGFTTLFIECD
ncbi:MAG: SH3 domain-containing protein [Chloroflexi bacterium]|nr:SH3 domain-containing protein [Chloroflexota bacterium]